MTKLCARCDKTVYPVEELKCLDKVWHKGCFKCQECGMTLSMKTYKGFNKLPYCEAHIPKAKATSVAETPEMKRLAENTKIQSNVQYHAEFEKNKAKFTQVADDPETRRIKQNTKNISNVSYHGDLEKKAIMELKRNVGNNIVNKPNSQPQQEKQSPPAPQPVQDPAPVSQSSYRGTAPVHHSSNTTNVGAPRKQHLPQQQQQHLPQQQQHYYSKQMPSNTQKSLQQNIPASSPYYPTSQHTSTAPAAYHSHAQQSVPHTHPQHAPQSHHKSVSHSHPQQPFHPQSVPQSHMYQDANHNSPYSSRTSQTLIYSSQTGPVNQADQNVGSIADYDPLNNQFGSISESAKQNPAGGYRQENTYKVQRSHLYPETSGMTPNQMAHMSQPMTHKVTAPPTNLGRCYRAIYDYEAADSDEISFKDGDLIINCTSIDEGWMTGTVQRLGRTGMLPANYVERVS